MHPYKILHMYYKNMLIIITDLEGQRAFISLMRRLFMFEEVYEIGDKENNILRKKSTTKLF
jgi:hypothetical protein